MTEPLVIVVTGPPATGKTTVGRQIAEAMHLPFINKDGIKESLFDTLGWSDVEWSKRLGVASYAILYHLIEAQLHAGVSFVVESNFHPAYDTERFAALHAMYDFATFQVVCIADGDILYERFAARSASGARHPGHRDELRRDGFEEILRRGRQDPLAIGGETFELDMTDLDAVNLEGVLAAIQSYASRPPQAERST
ncbi:MAG: ATP-binding protein [Thermomicrobia bacterium]|nr:ATP-binding protein [Thermomicrobia bacterium]MCA1725025.1 ATP-binding protein [Thermomicrobia bacterium]